MTWEIQAVNAGRFAVYVVLIPEARILRSSARRRTWRLPGAGRYPGGALPISIAVPLALGLAAAAVRFGSAGPPSCPPRPADGVDTLPG